MEQTKEKTRVRSVNIVFLITILLSVIISFLPLGILAEIPALQLIFSQLVFLLPSVVYMCYYRIPYKEAVRFRKMKIGDIALSVLFGILIQPVMTLINALSMVFASNTTSTFLVSMSEQIPFLASVILVAVVPAILEETVYRGVFYNEYSRWNPWKGAILSGVLFGIMHGNLNQFCYATVMGFLFALLIEATGSILSTMLVHFWINVCSVIMIYVYPKLYEVAQSFHRMYVEHGNEEMAKQLETAFGDMSLTGPEWMQKLFDQSAGLQLTVADVLSAYGLPAVVTGVLAFLVYKKLAQRNGNWVRICRFATGEHTGEEKEERLITIPLVVAIVIGVAFMIVFEILVQTGA